jgi:flagellar biosynthesis chaperone FliJ
MSDQESLKTVLGIREKRVKRAEERLQAAARALASAQDLWEQAHLTLNRYRLELPGRIEKLYADCMGRPISRDDLQAKAEQESILRAHLSNLSATERDRDHQLKLAREEKQAAEQALGQERLRADAMAELLKAERAKWFMAVQRREAKAMDDFANAKYLRNRLH